MTVFSRSLQGTGRVEILGNEVDFKSVSILLKDDMDCPRHGNETVKQSCQDKTVSIC